jgi:hypothetical protein
VKSYGILLYILSSGFTHVAPNNEIIVLKTSICYPWSNNNLSDVSNTISGFPPWLTTVSAGSDQAARQGNNLIWAQW